LVEINLRKGVYVEHALLYNLIVRVNRADS